MIDVLAATPIVSATSLARGLDIAVKTAAALLQDLTPRGIAIEVTRRTKRRPLLFATWTSNRAPSGKGSLLNADRGARFRAD